MFISGVSGVYYVFYTYLTDYYFLFFDGSFENFCYLGLIVIVCYICIDLLEAILNMHKTLLVFIALFFMFETILYLFNT